ncbi:glycosyl transferase family 2 [Jiella sp. MQZ9-1]|uniref:Glycosyl transferase family 2 n=1 Tax=Jiella flava TaxID=2816857 RepID=A0A939FX53_9HYPH|nr:glycosyl transferase family 2 [Jiella flava]MBO0661663.1 glycosyl transferase family 2 [Jiella flava]MCD2470305.1 glycosyl transferase family 2 [Jiella flava]
MLSVFIDCGPDDQALAKSLASLVPGAVEGVVREVLLVDRGMGPEARKVADHAGCRLIVAATLREAVRTAKGDWLLFLEPGARLQPGWIGAAIEHADQVVAGRAKTPAARFRRAAIDRPRLFQRLRQIRTALAEGFLVTKSQAISLGGKSPTLEAMARGVAVTRLDAEIRPALASRRATAG